MQLLICSLRKTFFNGEAQALNCKTETGEITILDHHKPLISILAPGTLKVTNHEGKDSFIPVKNGFVEVKSENQVRLIVKE